MASQQSFTPGEIVKIITGPFLGHTGIIKDINQAKQALKVIVQLGNRPNVIIGVGELPIELMFREVTKMAA